MNQWQQKLHQGNVNFHQCKWRSAETAYLDAARMLEHEWFKDLDNPQLMMAWIAAMHNLAALYENQKIPQKASEFLVFPYRRIITLIKSGGLSEAFKPPLLKALKCTVIPLLEFSTKHRICKCCQHYLDEAKEWLSLSWPDLQYLHRNQNHIANQSSPTDRTIH
ncbi:MULTISPECIES: hypothetical protein [unclassified Endozoicomonas]|uniref:hypothetical protein n=1 Tax=unclassified Endozoicomonas TaxID=2644528 RepID=UPI003BB7069B